MNDMVINVRGLGKEFQIGSLQKRSDTLRDSIANTFNNLLRRNKQASPKMQPFWAVKDINFQVNRGEVLGIIGRNGAGKSTLLKLLSRITAPTEGEIRVLGRIGTLLEVGTGFHPELSGRENIYMNGAILGMSRREIDSKFDEIVAFSEIEKFIDTPVKRYSSGMYIRLAFAVAAHLEPEILLVDEVLAVGDVAFQRKCLGKMSDIAGAGRTIVFVSHNMAAIQQLCNRVLVLEGGNVIADTTTEKGLQVYLSAFQKALDLDNLAEIERIPSHFGQKARITRVQLTNSNQQSVDTLNYGEDFAIEIECAVKEPVEGVSFLVGIDSILGDRIVTLTSKEKHATFDAVNGQTISGRLQVRDLLLNPGVYRLTVALFAVNVGIDVVRNVTAFTITDIAINHVFFSQMNIGHMHHALQDWSITALEYALDGQ